MGSDPMTKIDVYSFLKNIVINTLVPDTIKFRIKGRPYRSQNGDTGSDRGL